MIEFYRSIIDIINPSLLTLGSPLMGFNPRWLLSSSHSLYTLGSPL